MSLVNKLLMRNFVRGSPDALRFFLRSRNFPTKHTPPFRMGEANATDTRDNSLASNTWSSQTFWDLTSVPNGSLLQPLTVNTTDAGVDTAITRQEMSTPTFYDDTECRPPESLTPNLFYDEQMSSGYHKEPTTTGSPREQLLYSSGLNGQLHAQLYAGEVQNLALGSPQSWSPIQRYPPNSDSVTFAEQVDSTNMEGTCLSNVPNQYTELKTWYANQHTPLNADSLTNLSRVYTEPPNTSDVPESFVDVERTQCLSLPNSTVEPTAQPYTSPQNTMYENTVQQYCPNSLSTVQQYCPNSLSTGERNVPCVDNTQVRMKGNSCHESGNTDCMKIKSENTGPQPSVSRPNSALGDDLAGCPSDMFSALGGDVDEKLRDATLQSYKTGTVTPIVKEELRALIQARRHSEGLEEIVVKFDTEKKQLPLSHEEEVRKEKRKESNKKAAKKSRTKRQNARKAIEKEEKQLTAKNIELKHRERSLLDQIALERAKLAAIGINVQQQPSHIIQAP